MPRLLLLFYQHAMSLHAFLMFPLIPSCVRFPSITGILTTDWFHYDLVYKINCCIYGIATNGSINCLLYLKFIQNTIEIHVSMLVGYSLISPESFNWNKTTAWKAILSVFKKYILTVFLKSISVNLETNMRQQLA